jgi:hypothetical protein
MFDESKFWALVDKSTPNGCWKWKGQVTTRGYGFVHYDHTKHYVTRLAYQYANGVIGDDMIVASCPDDKSCVNPSHLHAFPKVRPLSERFWEKVDIRTTDECWEWQAAKDKRGYGVISDKPNDKNSLAAHRVAYELHYGANPADALVCHRCDNPSCVNPHHLWLGDYGDNNRDARDKNRRYQPDVSGENNGRAKLSLTDVALIRQHYNNDMTAEQLANRFGVSVSTVRYAAKGKSWK